ncbi:hypothetical protein Dac01nite_10920 [Demequina activiva]|uniref:Uncharacterized protein n=1 Tax=Demequina activiva TaxID=1582364 RepID=A0A919UJY8_9MICO|nr:hypothetical protein Dac01nite_10920 [Demequina activiva]
MLSPAKAAAGAAEEQQDEADHEEHDSDGRQDRDRRENADQEENQTKNDHGVSNLSRPHRWDRGGRVAVVNAQRPRYLPDRFDGVIQNLGRRTMDTP